MNALKLIEQLTDQTIDEHREWFKCWKGVDDTPFTRPLNFDDKDAKTLCILGYTLAHKFYDAIYEQLQINFRGHCEQGDQVKTLSAYNENAPTWFKYDLHTLSITNDLKWGLVLLYRYYNQQSFDAVLKSSMLEKYNLGDKNNEVIYLEAIGKPTCHMCGTNLEMGLNLDTLTIEPMYSYVDRNFVPAIACDYQDNSPFQYQFSFPSGKAVFANILYRVLGDQKQKQLDKQFHDSLPYNKTSINHRIGLKNTILFYANNDLLHVQVGNSCPCVFYNKDNHKITIRQNKYDDNDNLVEMPECGECVGGICTDLWAVTAMDYDVFVAHCRENENDPQQMLEELDCFIVDVPKGPYTVTDYYNSNQFDEDGVNGYATIVFDGESV